MNATPVLILAHRRPNHTLRVLKAVKKSGPRPIYVSCDGPRNESEASKVEAVHRLFKDLFWAERVHTRFLPTNLGSRFAVTTALDWFFSKESEGIILEDDCIASPDFFRLCEFFLAEHRSDRSVWGITGSNTARITSQHLYTFVQQPLTWGWATWADRWQKRDADLTDYQLRRLEKEVWVSAAHRVVYKRHLDRILYQGKPDAWDYMWAWTVMSHRGLWGITHSNLITNIGTGEDATNSHPQEWIGTSQEALDWTLHPSPIAPDVAADREVLRQIHGLKEPLWFNHLLNIFRKFAQWFQQLAEDRTVNLAKSGTNPLTRDNCPEIR